MLKIHQFVIAVIVAAAWCGIVLSMFGSKPVVAARVPVPMQTIAAAVLPVEAPPDLPVVPLETSEPPLAPYSAPPAILTVSRAPLSGHYVTIDAMLIAAAAVGWPQTPVLPVVAICESGVDLDHDGVKESVDVTAVSPGGDRGPLQINPVHARPGGLVERTGYQWDDMLSLVPNLTVGLAIYTVAGNRFTPWSCDPGAY